MTREVKRAPASLLSRFIRSLCPYSFDVQPRSPVSYGSPSVSKILPHSARPKDKFLARERRQDFLVEDAAQLGSFTRPSTKFGNSPQTCQRKVV